MFDDFEVNFDTAPDGPPVTCAAGDFVVRHDAATVLAPLIDVLFTTGSRSKIIITSRYTVPESLTKSLIHVEPVVGMQGADLEKLVRPLRSHLTGVTTKQEQRVIALAAGNPRLLHWLYRGLHISSTEDFDAITDQVSRDFNVTHLIDVLIDSLSRPSRHLLELLCIPLIPLDLVSVECLSGEGSALPHLREALRLGLIEVFNDELGTPEYLVPMLVRKSLALPVSESLILHASRLTDHLMSQYCGKLYSLALSCICELYRLASLCSNAEAIRKVGPVIASRLTLLTRYAESHTHCSEMIARNFHTPGLLIVEARNQRELGCFLQGKALLLDAIGLFRELNQPSKEDQYLLGIALHDLGVVYQKEHLRKEAQDAWGEALTYHRAVQNVKGIADTLHEMANAALSINDYSTAESLYNESLHHKEKLSDMDGVGAAYHGLSQLALCRGTNDQSLALMRKSIYFREKAGNLAGAASTLLSMSSRLFSTGDFQGALELIDEANSVFQTLGDIDGQIDAMRFRAKAALELNYLDDAELLANNALRIASQFELSQDQGNCHLMLANIAEKRYDHKTATVHVEASLEIADRTSDVRLRIGALVIKARLLRMESSGSGDTLHELWKKCLTEVSELGDVSGRAFVYREFGAYLHTQRQNSEAKHYTSESMEQYRRLGDVQGLALSIGQMAELAHDDDAPTAIQCYKEAISLLVKCGSFSHAFRLLGNLGVLNQTSPKEYAQSLWLSLYRPNDPDLIVSTILRLSHIIGAAHSAILLLGWYGKTCLRKVGTNHSRGRYYEDQLVGMLCSHASSKGIVIVTQEQFDRWWMPMKSMSAQSAMRELANVLSMIIDNSWLFDCKLVEGSESKFCFLD